MSPILAAPPRPEAAPGEADPSVQLCAFFVGETEYAIDIMRVDEILQPHPVTAFPKAPGWVDGVMNLRGVLIPVVDLRRRLGAQGSPPRNLEPRWLVAFVGKRRVALVVDGVSEVVRARRSELKPVPPSLSSGVSPAVVGACGPSEGARLLLDIKALVREDGRPEQPGG